MSLTLNMVGGAGGAGLKDTDAVLVVTVPTGSTVTATKGGVTLTPTMWVTYADPTLDVAIFSIKSSLFDAVNPWAVTATLGTKFANYSVTIDSACEYSVVVSYMLYIVKDGVYETTGYDLYNQLRTPHPVTVTDGDGYKVVTMDGIYLGGIVTRNKVNLADYSTLKAEMTTPSNATSWAGLWPSYGYSSDTEINNAAIARVQHTYNSKTLVSLDVSSYTSEAYVGVEITASTNRFVNVWNLWLE